MLDFDGDGDLDLFFAQGVPLPVGKGKVPPADVLLRNDSRGRFTDVSAAVGLSCKGYGQGVTVADYDGDGDPDVYVTRYGGNALWRNNGDGTFEDVAPSWGVALNGRGQAEANMGIAHADTDGDGLLDLFVTHFVGEHDTLWRARRAPAGVFFVDQTYEAGLGLDSLPLTGWGLAAPAVAR